MYEDVETQRVRIAHEELPDRFRPSYLCRYDDVTIIITDPRSTRVEVTAWMIDNLTVAERNYIRMACGETPVGLPLRPETLEGLTRVPPSLLIVDKRRPVSIVNDIRSRAERQADQQRVNDVGAWMARLAF